MTIFSEGYLFYGWTGTVLAMLIVGAVLAVVRRRLDNPRLVLVYLALLPTIIQIEPEFSSYLITLVQRSLVFLIVFVLLTHTTAVAAGRQRVRPMTRPRVLVVADYYLPGFRAGGPVRAISNTIRRLSAHADFSVVTRNHDADGSTYRRYRRGTLD